MLNRLPKNMPCLADMLHDMASPSTAEVAKALGVTERTVYRWLEKGAAPKPVMLALFWVTRWGLQWADAEVFNLAQVHMQLNAGLKRQVAELKAEIVGVQQRLESLGRLGEFGSANDPLTGVTGQGPAQPSAMSTEPGPLTFLVFEKAMAQQPANATTSNQTVIPTFIKRQARVAGRSAR